MIGPNYSFDDTIRLEYYRLQKISEGSISLNIDKQYKLDGSTDVASGMVHVKKRSLFQESLMPSMYQFRLILQS
jgi:type I restriction enzyme R subunit